jgi:hypothetical protein
MNIVEMWYWFKNHPKLNLKDHEPWIEITPVLVDPKTKEVNDDSAKNTEVNWWLEAGYYAYIDSEIHPNSVHDTELDCGGKTTEEAVEKLYNLTLKKYGEYDNVRKSQRG